MAASYRRFTRTIFLIANILAVIAFALACIAPYLNPEKWWLFSLMGLGFAFIIITLVAFFFFWLVFSPRYALLSVLAMAIGYKSIMVFFAFHVPHKFDYIKSPDAIRIAHWNVARFTEWKRNNNAGSMNRLRMMDLIKEQNADVLCFQEFFTSTLPDHYDNINYIRKELNYPYFYFSYDNDGDRQWIGQAIFSRYRMIDTGLVRFHPPGRPETLIHADLQVGNDTLRIYTTHLQSFQFKKQDYESIEQIKHRDEGMVQNSKSIFSKLKKGTVLRAAQANEVKEVIGQSPYPYILTGDFNDVPNSYTYYKIRGNNLRDAFLLSNFGVGKTFSYIAPTLRIDYMLMNPDFNVTQFNRIVKDYSDHYMLVGDFTWKRK